MSQNSFAKGSQNNDKKGDKTEDEEIKEQITRQSLALNYSNFLKSDTTNGQKEDTLTPNIATSTKTPIAKISVAKKSQNKENIIEFESISKSETQVSPVQSKKHLLINLFLLPL